MYERTVSMPGSGRSAPRRLSHGCTAPSPAATGSARRRRVGRSPRPPGRLPPTPRRPRSSSSPHSGPARWPPAAMRPPAPAPPPSPGPPRCASAPRPPRSPAMWAGNRKTSDRMERRPATEWRKEVGVVARACCPRGALPGRSPTRIVLQLGVHAGPGVLHVSALALQAVQGLSVFAPVRSKSTLRVTSVRPWTSAVAAISASLTGRGSGTWRAALRRAMETSTGRMRSSKAGRT
jgi:hypothetical protein